MKKILIIHPEGNTANNPNLYSILESLQIIYCIDLVGMKRSNVYQDVLFENVNFIFFDDFDSCKIINDNLINDLSENDYSLIIGVDLGIIPASIISQKKNILYGLISYEIIFEDEFDEFLKTEEVNACQNISFAICQDPLRSYLLSKENKIKLEKILNIPVAGRFNGPYKKNKYLREKLNIPDDKKIALYIGSLGTWTLTDVLINQVDNWSDDWVLVLHPRYANDEFVFNYSEKISRNKKIFVSTEPFSNIEDLEKIICSADIGIALYNYDFLSHYTGKNIIFLGLSSGKIATYFKYGLPVIINSNINISDLVKKYNLGLVAYQNNHINPNFINDKDLSHYSENSTKFYLEILDFAIYEKKLISIIEKVIKGVCPLNEIKSNNDNCFNFNEYSYINALEKIFTQSKDAIAFKSKYYEIVDSYAYKIGGFMLSPIRLLKRLVKVIR